MFPSVITVQLGEAKKATRIFLDKTWTQKEFMMTFFIIIIKIDVILKLLYN